MVRQCEAHSRFDCRDYRCQAAETARHTATDRWADDGGYLTPSLTAAAGTGEPVLTPEQWESLHDQAPRNGMYLLADHGRFFATRAAAAHIRGLIEAATPTGPIVVRLDGVEAITGAFADELLGELFVRHGPRLQVIGGNPDVAETAATALQRRSR